jgi:serine protease
MTGLFTYTFRICGEFLHQDSVYLKKMWLRIKMIPKSLNSCESSLTLLKSRVVSAHSFHTGYFSGMNFRHAYFIHRKYLSLLLLLVACNPNVDQTSISGTVSIASGTLQISSNSASQSVTAQEDRNAQFVPGEVLITFKTDLSARSLSSLSVGGISLRSVRASSLERTSLYRSDTVRSRTGTLALIEQLKLRKDVVWAEPNQILRATAVPNDPGYKLQWHYDAINLPSAWNLETGGTNPVTVAVVDSGLLLGHPDVQGRFWSGYDFISDASQAIDGDGRDGDPDDPGDTPGGQSSYHGSHVAGTIAAKTNNSIGVAGVSWGATILPVRVLGLDESGSVSDIIDGILWAAGLPITGAPINTHPAQVINLSLGGSGVCPLALQRAFDAVNTQGAIVVVAAGNENAKAATTTPASCSGVITVGATNRAGSRAPYSNYGPRVDVMGPGGQGDASNPLDEVLSLDKNNQSGQFVYGYKQGTSMATPHVAGVLALLKSKDPILSFSRALNVLKSSARPLTAAQCTGAGPAQTTEDCGAGLIDAKKALDLVDVAGTVLYACYYLGNGNCDLDLSSGVKLNGSAMSSPYRFSALESADYAIVAWKDITQDNKINKGDLYGFYAQGETLKLVRPPSSNINLEISPVLSDSQVNLIQPDQLERLAIKTQSAR